MIACGENVGLSSDGIESRLDRPFLKSASGSKIQINRFSSTSINNQRQHFSRKLVLSYFDSVPLLLSGFCGWSFVQKPELMRLSDG